MTDPQVPTPDQILATGLAKLKQLRPDAYKFFNTGSGVWGNVVAGLRAQVTLELARIAAATKAGQGKA